MKYLKGNKDVAITLTVVLAIALAGLPLAAVTKGATVEVTMADGNWVKGELLAVRSDFLLVYDRDARLGKSLDLQQVAQVRVYRKPKLLAGLAIGLGVGLAVSIYNLKKIDHESLMPLFEIVRSFLPLPAAGLSGGLLGAFGSIPSKYSLAGLSQQIVQRNLIRLKRFAREAYI